MIGLGTIINAGAIVIGGITGLCGGKFMNERLQETLQLTCGVSVLLGSLTLSATPPPSKPA